MSHGPIGPLAFWEGYENELTTLALYAVGIALYALFVGLFYQRLSRRNLLRSKRAAVQAGPVRFVVLFPLFSFGMFLVLSIALFFLAKSQTVPAILLLSMAVVAGVRVAAYINENSAEDLAKLMPLGLLGVLLVDPGFLSLTVPFDRIAQLPGHANLVGVYLLALVVLEVALRAAWVATGGRKRARAREEREARTRGAPPTAPPAPVPEGRRAPLATRPAQPGAGPPPEQP